MTGDYVQYLTGAPNAVGFSKSIADVVGKKEEVWKFLLRGEII